MKCSFIYVFKKLKYLLWFDVKMYGFKLYELFVKDKLVKFLSRFFIVFSFWFWFLVKVMSIIFVKDYKFGFVIFFKEYYGVGMISFFCFNLLKWIGVYVNILIGMIFILISYCK